MSNGVSVTDYQASESSSLSAFPNFAQDIQTDIDESNIFVSQSDDDSKTECESTTDAESEVWELETDDEHNDVSTSEGNDQVSFIVSLFVALLQLCYNISDRAVIAILHFLQALLAYISTLRPAFAPLFSLAEKIPKTLYSMRKILNIQKNVTTYVVCPKCNTLYKETDCIQTSSTGIKKFCDVSTSSKRFKKKSM